MTSGDCFCDEQDHVQLPQCRQLVLHQRHSAGNLWMPACAGFFSTHATFSGSKEEEQLRNWGVIVNKASSAVCILGSDN
eukprot:770368-Amphidinium_carterae.2